MRTIVVAPDKFKGSLTAAQAATAIANGIASVDRNAPRTLCPMADGGEGTVDVFLARGARRCVARVHGPLGEPVDAVFALDGTTAVLEMASASGLPLLKREQYDPLRADTFGTGELIDAALDAGATHLIVGLGGSATNDAGIGMLRALGVRFADAQGQEIRGDVAAYGQLASIDTSGLDARLSRRTIEIAVDVDNPLYGPNGAARTFAAQKGAGAHEIDVLDRTLEHVAAVTARTLGRDDARVPGGGAAGGLGFAFIAFLHAVPAPGVALVAREYGLAELMRNASLCFTGEGKIDEQTLHGKVVDGVAKMAHEAGVPVVAFGGAIEADAAAALKRRGVRTERIAPDGTPRAESLARAAEFLERAAARVFREVAGTDI